MSRFLTRKKSFIMLVSGMLLVTFIFAFTTWWIVSVLIIIGLCLLLVNLIILLKTDKRRLLSAHRDIRQYKYLVIGDECAPSRLRDFVNESDGIFSIMSPGRSLEASYQILLHTSSVLKDKGVCVILYGGQTVKKKYDIFDVPYFSMITRKELGLKSGFKTLLPLLFEPCKSVQILCGLFPSGYKLADCPMAELKSFCQERGFSLIYLTK